MFGLQNFRGSCWVNACLQGIFRIPDVQSRYSKGIFETNNVLDECLCKIWKTQGKEGLPEFFQAVKTHHMPAGNGIGDSHELLQYLCDRLPYLDELCRFKVADAVQCNSCPAKIIKEDSVIEFDIIATKQDTPILECIQRVVAPTRIDTWKCEKCNKQGCTNNYLIGSFPRVMVFHVRSIDGSVGYSSILVLNSKQYALIGVICYNGAHWWTYGRNLPTGSAWCKLDDQHIQNFGPKQFPVSTAMRILVYYCLDNNSL